MSGRIRITYTNIDTGESETVEIGPDSFLVVCGPDRYVVSGQEYPTKGTSVVTIRTHK